jgi:hypothetical protein
MTCDQLTWCLAGCADEEEGSLAGENKGNKESSDEDEDEEEEEEEGEKEDDKEEAKGEKAKAEKDGEDSEEEEEWEPVERSEEQKKKDKDDKIAYKVGHESGLLYVCMGEERCPLFSFSLSAVARLHVLKFDESTSQ